MSLLSETMVFSNFICLYYQLLVLSVLAVGTDMYDGILVTFGKNVGPGKIDDEGRVKIALPSSRSRLHCFALCARDPSCSKCVRYDNDGTFEAAFQKLLTGSHPHTDEYFLKCKTQSGIGSSDNDTHLSRIKMVRPPLPVIINKSPPPAQKVHKSPKLQVKPSTLIMERSASEFSPSDRETITGLKDEKPAGNVMVAGTSSKEMGSVSKQTEVGIETLKNRMTTISTNTPITDKNHGSKETAEVFVRITYKVVTETGKTIESGTDCFVYLRVHGDNNDLEELYLNEKGFEMQPGQIDSFIFNRTKDIGHITKMELRLNQFGFGPAWFCVRVELERQRQYSRHTQVEVYHSSLNRWFLEHALETFASDTITYNIPYNLTKTYLT